MVTPDGKAQLKSAAAPTKCLNIYGGVPKGCYEGVRVHLNDCGGHKAGDAFRVSAVTGLVTASACNNLCLLGEDAGNLTLSNCENATKWQMRHGPFVASQMPL